MFLRNFFTKYFHQKLASNTRRPYICTTIIGNGYEKYAKVAQLVERDLAKVEVAGSNPVFRSANEAPQVGAFFVACPGGGMVDTKDLKSFGQ